MLKFHIEIVGILPPLVECMSKRSDFVENLTYRESIAKIFILPIETGGAVNAPTSERGMQPHSWRWRVQGGIRADSTGRVPRYLEDMRMINALTIIKLVIEIIAAAMQLIAQYHHLV